MKFAKEYSAQMVPEWQRAYMDYNYLKSILKDLHISELQNRHQRHYHHHHHHHHHLDASVGGDHEGLMPHVLSRTISNYRAFSGLLSRDNSTQSSAGVGDVALGSNDHHHHDIQDHHVILVDAPPTIFHRHHQPVLLEEGLKESIVQDDASHHNHNHDQYGTKFLLSSEGGEYEVVFFKRLDDEFNKVNKFYKEKVEEVREEAALLNKQMDALIAFRLKVHYPDDHGKLLSFEKLSRDIANSASTLSASTPTTPGGSTRATEMVHLDVIDESNEGSSHGTILSEESIDEPIRNYSGESSTDPSSHGPVGDYSGNQSSPTNNQKRFDESNYEDQMGDDNDDDDEEEDGNDDDTVAINPYNVEKLKHNPTRAATKPIKLAPLEMLNNVKINNTLETPRSTIKGILKKTKKEELNFTKQNLRKVEQQLKSAFIHFYHKLQLLKSYSILNLLAFSKIIKRFDKITSRSVSSSYLDMVDKSYLGRSEDINRLIERVEVSFIKYFANSNRSKGMNMLNPKKRKERHRTTFSTGFFSGCAMALIVCLILVINIRKILKKNGGKQYMDTMFPLYSLFGFVVLHMLLYAGNLYFWKRYRINYPFIFGFKKGTELGFREVLLLSTILATLALASVLANLDMEMDKRTKDYKALTELIPLALVCLIVLILFLPFNIIYRSSRFFLLRTVFRSICAPLYKVTVADFVLADQITSQIQAIRSLEFYICYYGWGDYKHRQSTCERSDVYNTFGFILAAFPYWIRCLQSIRLWLDGNEIMGYNAIKYFSTIVAVVLRTAYTKQDTTAWWVLALISSVFAAVFSTWWDFVVDWGLLNRKSKNRWLRDKLLVSQKSVYYGVMVLNVLLRFAWIQTLLKLEIPFLHNQATVAIVACLEILRRGVWNFFRLENIHLINIKEYRASKMVQHPFHYEEEEEKDE